jgi:transposase
LETNPSMKRLPVVAHLPADEVGVRYRSCSDAREKTRWHLVWLLLRDETLSCARAGPLVGLSDVHARTLLERWNARGPDGLADRRRANTSPGKLTPDRQAEVYDALQKESPDGGLWSGPKLARYVRDRWGVEVCPETGWRWLRKLGFRLVVPRPRHPRAASPDEQRRWL